jgi:molybdopterin-containing oxidoreductase family iron-sulfur binding subunit
MDCVRACIAENNQDRRSDMQYIRIHEHQKGEINFEHATDDYFHEVPAAGHFYIGTQCFFIARIHLASMCAP